MRHFYWSFSSELTRTIYIISHRMFDMSGNVSNKSRRYVRELYFRLYTNYFNKTLCIQSSKFCFEICLKQRLYRNDNNEYQVRFPNSLLSPTTLITFCLLIVDKETWMHSNTILAFWNKEILCIFCTGSNTSNRIATCNSRKFNFVKFQFAEYSVCYFPFVIYVLIVV